MPKLVLVPVDTVKNIFTKEYYIPLAIMPGGCHVLLNHRNEAEIVESYLFEPVESENGLMMEEEVEPITKRTTGSFYPSIWCTPNRMLEPGRQWKVGMSSLHERIKTAIGIRKLGFDLSPEDALLVDSKAHRIQLFKVSIEQSNAFIDVVSDGYNLTSVGCIVRNDVTLDQLDDVVNYLFYDHGFVNGIKFKPIYENNLKTINKKVKEYLDACFGHAATCSKCNKIDFDLIKNQLFYDFLAVINDWEYRAYFLHYNANGEHRRIIIWDEQGCLLVFCLDYWFH